MTNLINLKQAAIDALGSPSKMLSFSKSNYLHDHPDHVVVFNANLVARNPEDDSAPQKIWYGDLDLTIDEPLLVDLAGELGVTLYVLREMDARFEYENAPRVEHYIFCTDGLSSVYEPSYRMYQRRDDGRMVHTPVETPTPRRLVYEEESYESVPPLIEGDEFQMHLIFGGINEDVTPLVNWYAQIARVYGLSQEEALSTWISEEDYTELERLSLLWIQAYYPYLREHKQQSELAFYLMNYGPNHFRNPDEESADWIIPGQLYRRRK